MTQTNDTLKRYYNKKKKRKKQKKFVFYSVFVMFFVLLIGILSLTVFFNVKDIAVTGNARYTAQQIKDASGLVEGQNLFRLNKFKVIDKLYAKLPYLSEISIDRHLPVGIEIIVTECTPYAYVESDGAFYLIDENLKILEKTDTAPENLPCVMGITPVAFEEGSLLKDVNGLENFLLSLTHALKAQLGDNCITGIDVTASYDISFEYEDHLTVKVGTVEKIDNKIQIVKRIIEENRSTETAIIDVSGELVYYRPVDPEEDLPEEEMTEEPPEEPDEEQDTSDSAEENEKENE